MAALGALCFPLKPALPCVPAGSTRGLSGLGWAGTVGGLQLQRALFDLANWRDKVANELCVAITVLPVPEQARFKAPVAGGREKQWYRQGWDPWCVQSLQVPCLGPPFRGPGASPALRELA